MKKHLVRIIIIAMILCSVLSVSACEEENTNRVYSDTPMKFESREQVTEIVKEYYSYNNASDGWDFGLDSCLGCGAKVDAMDDVAEKGTSNEVMSNNSPLVFYSSKGAEEDSSTSAQDYTKTNVQVDGLDEGDIVKTDGKNIYYLCNGGLAIFSVDVNGNTSKVYVEEYENFIPQEMYILGNRLAVIGHQYEGIGVNYYVYGFGKSMVSVRIYDVSNVSAPTIERNVAIDGYLNTTRVKDGVLYLLSDYSFYYGSDSDYIPYIIDSANGGEKQELAIENLYYFEGVALYGYSVFARINLNDASDFTYKAYLGAGSNVYVSENNIYLSVTDYNYTYDEDNRAPEQSRISKFDLNTLEFKAVGRVDGCINDRYSLDEYMGNLRVATTIGYTAEDYSAVYVLNDALEIIGSVSNIAPGERIYSARFSGTVGNIVTYRQIDPLFKIDLSDPANPTVSDGLKKTGVSYYLQYVDGTDLIIGLGYGTDSEDSVRTNNMIEVALFDNSGTESKLINRLYIGDKDGYANCDAMYDARMIVYDKDKDIFAFPASISGEYDTNAFYVFGFATGELKLKAVLSDLTNADITAYKNYMNGAYHYYSDYSNSFYAQYVWKYINRGARVGNYLFTLSSAKVVGYSLIDFSKVSETAVSTITCDEDGSPVITFPQ